MGFSGIVRMDPVSRYQGINVSLPKVLPMLHSGRCLKCFSRPGFARSRTEHCGDLRGDFAVTCAAGMFSASASWRKCPLQGPYDAARLARRLARSPPPPAATRSGGTGLPPAGTGATDAGSLAEANHIEDAGARFLDIAGKEKRLGN